MGFDHCGSFASMLLRPLRPQCTLGVRTRTIHAPQTTALGQADNRTSSPAAPNMARLFIPWSVQSFFLLFPTLHPVPVPKVLYTEVVSNPTLRVADIRALADLAHSHVVRERGQEEGQQEQGAAGGSAGAAAPPSRLCQLVVDNTFTPLVVSPKRLGADVVVHRWVQ